MRITEGQLRRIIRQEVRALTEMPAPRAGMGAPGSLDRRFKKTSPYESGASVDDYEARAFRREMKKIADMMGAPDIEGLRVSEDPKVISQVITNPGRGRSLAGGYMIARAGTLLGEPVVVTDEEGMMSVYKWIG